VVDLNLNLDGIFKKRENIVMAAVIAASLFLGNSLYKGQMAAFARLREGIRLEKEKGELYGRIMALHEKLKSVKRRSWDTIDSQVIIEQIFGMGLEMGVKIKDISPGARQEESYFVVVPLTITGEATFMNLTKFLRMLETFPMFIRVKSITASPLADVVDPFVEPGLGFNLVLEAPYFK
jgi:hypothetical protein